VGADSLLVHIAFISGQTNDELLYVVSRWTVTEGCRHPMIFFARFMRTIDVGVDFHL
jgi:hypothetical protein